MLPAQAASQSLESVPSAHVASSSQAPSPAARHDSSAWAGAVRQRSTHVARRAITSEPGRDYRNVRAWRAAEKHANRLPVSPQRTPNRGAARHARASPARLSGGTRVATRGPIEMKRCAWLLAAWSGAGAGCCGGEGSAPTFVTPAQDAIDAGPPGADSGVADLPVRIGRDGAFVLNGHRTVVIGVEEERNVLGDAAVSRLGPRLAEIGANFVVVYLQNVQDDAFYDALEAEGIWVAQHLGTLKKETGLGFAGTGGVIGTLPDEPWLGERMVDIEDVVPRLAGHRNILFWWLGGEFVEPVFHSPDGIAVTRDHVRRYREAIRALDPLERPFTVSHHFLEAVESDILPYIDFSDLTDFTWFTVAGHLHAGDVVPGGGWWPLARVDELPGAMTAAVRRASTLDRGRPIFLGGLFGQAPAAGPCARDDQPKRLLDAWDAIAGVPHMGLSAYHLDAWNDNAIPHALLEWTGEDWVVTPAGRALGTIAADFAAR